MTRTDEATKKILYCVLIAFLFVVGPYVILNFWGPGDIGKWWSLFALYIALTSGLMGAFFSRLIAVQRHWGDFTLDEVFQQRELSYTLLRAGVGMCGALIVYFFLRSGFVSGPLFPVFKDVMIDYVNITSPDAVNMTFVMPSQALALLTFAYFALMPGPKAFPVVPPPDGGHSNGNMAEKVSNSVEIREPSPQAAASSSGLGRQARIFMPLNPARWIFAAISACCL